MTTNIFMQSDFLKCLLQSNINSETLLVSTFLQLYVIFTNKLTFRERIIYIIIM